MWRDRFYNARLLAPSVSSFAASMSAPLFREIPSAAVMSPNTSVAYRQAKGAIQDVVFDTLYILSNTNVQYSGRFTVRRLQNLFSSMSSRKGLAAA
jgi:hypothetical protein